MGQLVTNTTTAETFPTIQAAIDDADTLNGHTLQAAPGTYNAEPAWPINVNKSLTLQSAAGAATTIIDPGANGQGAMRISADNVTVDGFTVRHGTQAYSAVNPQEHTIWVAVNYSTVKNCTIVGWGGNQACVYIGDRQAGVPTALAIYGYKPATPANSRLGHTIENNTFRYAQSGEGWGIFAYDLSDSLIKGNQFVGDAADVGNWADDEGATGTGIIIHQATAGTGVPSPGLGSVIIEDNTARYMKYTWLTFYAAYPYNDSLGKMYEQPEASTVDKVIVRNNTVEDCRTAVNFHRANKDDCYGATKCTDLTVGANNVAIGPNNQFHDNEDGVTIDAPREKPPGCTASVQNADNIAINTNDMYSNTSFGVENGAANTVDAERNWWGNTTGPTHASNLGGSGDAVSNNVDFDPWYTDAAKTTLSTQITVAANPNNITVNGAASVVTATVSNANGNPVPNGTVVAFQTDLGTLGSQTASATTTGGNANVNLTPGNTAGIATVRATADGRSAATSVFINALGAPLVTSSKTEQTQTGSYTVNASTEAGVTVTKEGVGTPIITVAQYGGNPGTPTGFATGAGYVDVYLDNTAGVTQVTLNFCPATNATVILWWNGATWMSCSHARFDNATGCVIVTIRADTRPAIADLRGAPFAKGVFPGPPPGASGCGANSPPITNAGPDQTVSVGERVILDGSRSYDPDEDIPESGEVKAENRPLYVHQERGNLEFQWSFAVKYYRQGTPVLAIPAGSNVLATAENFTTEHGNFTPDEPGQYVLNLTLIDDFGASLTDQVTITAIVPTTCSHSFDAGWNLISLPLYPVSPHADVLLQGTTTAHPQVFVYEMGYQRTDALFPTGGYWVYFPNPGFMNVSGREITGDVTIELPHAGWHLIGSPYPIWWEYIRVMVNGVKLTVYEAVRRSVITSGCYCYSPETSEYWLSDYLLPWEGYWLRTLQDEVSLILPIARVEPGGEFNRVLTTAGGLLPPNPPQFSTSNFTVRAYPTPVRHSAVHFVLEGVANVVQIRVSVYTASGKRVWSDETVGTQLDGNARSEYGERLAWGPYIYTINALIDGRWVLGGRGLIFLAQEN